MKKAAEILAKVLDEKSRTLGKTYTSVFEAWSQIVGESLGEHSRIYEIASRNLFIEVDHPGWMQMLLMKKTQILRSVKRNYPALDIRDLRVKVSLNYASTVPSIEPVQTEPGGGEAAVHGDQRELDRVLSTVNHEELKQRLRRLFLKSIERDRSA